VNDARIKAMLKWSRKQLMQRKNRLLPKHADERFWGTAESQGDDRAGQCALDHEKTVRHHADVCCDAVPHPVSIQCSQINHKETL